MSQKALVYGDEPLERKFLYFPEGAGIRDDSDAAIYLRSLLSEGEIRYEVVYTQPGGRPEATTIVRSGPTAAIITTSAVRLDRDLDNRLLRVTIDDSEQLTRRIIERHGERAARGGTPTRDRSEWHALYEWILLQAPIQVRIPFAPADCALIPASAVRLRRDVQTVFTLTAAHAALHLDSRTRDTDGYVVATGADYDAARDLVDSILGANVEQIAPPWAQETWEAVPPDTWEEGITYRGARTTPRDRDGRRPHPRPAADRARPDRQPRVSLEAARTTCPRGQSARRATAASCPITATSTPRDGRLAIAADHPNRHRKHRSKQRKRIVSRNQNLRQNQQRRAGKDPVLATVRVTGQNPQAQERTARAPPVPVIWPATRNYAAGRLPACVTSARHASMNRRSPQPRSMAGD